VRKGAKVEAKTNKNNKKEAIKREEEALRKRKDAPVVQAVLKAQAHQSEVGIWLFRKR